MWFTFLMKHEILQLHCLLKFCSQIATEPDLHPVSQEEYILSISNVQDGASLDIVMNGFWGKDQSMHLLLFIFLIHLLHQILPVLYLHAVWSMVAPKRLYR